MSEDVMQALATAAEDQGDPEDGEEGLGPIERAQAAVGRLERLHGHIGDARVAMFEIGSDLVWMKQMFDPVDQPEWLKLAGLDKLSMKERELAVWWFYNRAAVEQAAGFLGPRMTSVKGIQTAFGRWKKAHGRGIEAAELMGTFPENPFTVADMQRHHETEVKSIKTNVAEMARAMVSKAAACPTDQTAERAQMLAITVMEAALAEMRETWRVDLNMGRPDDRTAIPQAALWQALRRRKK